MPHSNFKWRATKFNLRVGKCSCSQTFECALERDMNMKLRGLCGGPGVTARPLECIVSSVLSLQGFLMR